MKQKRQIQTKKLPLDNHRWQRQGLKLRSTCLQGKACKQASWRPLTRTIPQSTDR
jgi:hypothetical protein